MNANSRKCFFQWLKRIDDFEDAARFGEKNTIIYQGNKYGVLERPYHSSTDTDQLDASFLQQQSIYMDRYVIPSVQMKDAGVYVCGANNHGGFTHRSAILKILEPETPLKRKDENSTLHGIRVFLDFLEYRKRILAVWFLFVNRMIYFSGPILPGTPSPTVQSDPYLIVYILVPAAVCVAAFLAALICCIRRRSRTSVRSPSSKQPMLLTPQFPQQQVQVRMNNATGTHAALHPVVPMGYHQICQPPPPVLSSGSSSGKSTSTAGRNEGGVGRGAGFSLIPNTQGGTGYHLIPQKENMPAPSYPPPPPNVPIDALRLPPPPHSLSFESSSEESGHYQNPGVDTTPAGTRQYRGPHCHRSGGSVATSSPDSYHPHCRQPANGQALFPPAQMGVGQNHGPPYSWGRLKEQRTTDRHFV